MQKFGIVIDIAIARFSQNVLILVLLLQSEATKYWYCYWYCRPEATAIDIDIELKFSLSHSPVLDHTLRCGRPVQRSANDGLIIGGPS